MFFSPVNTLACKEKQFNTGSISFENTLVEGISRIYTYLLIFGEDHMNNKTHGMGFIFLLVVTTMLWVVIPFTQALAGGMGGTRADGCDDFWIADKPVFEGGKALSADTVEYNFSVKMRLGFDVSKEESNCKARPCTAKVVGSWNSKTGQASERFDITCTYGKNWYEPYPSSLTLTTLVTCPKDP
jgi:hypothetical protein